MKQRLFMPGAAFALLFLASTWMLDAIPVQAKVSIPESVQASAPKSIRLSAGKAVVIKLSEPAKRVSIGSREVADLSMLSPQEIYLLAKKPGETNVIVFGKSSAAPVVYDLRVVGEKDALVGIESSVHQLLPNEKDIRFSMAGNALVLTGTVSDATVVNKVLMIAKALTSQEAGVKVINMLDTRAPEQVMLEVKVAEIDKTLLEALGVQFNLNHSATLTGTGWSLLSGFLNGGNLAGGTGSVSKAGGTSRGLSFDAQKNDGLVKILAEPTIMAISGQEGSFLSGGKIFIPVPQSNYAGGTTITLEEREFGIGLRAIPTVLADGRINLRVAPEVSQLSTTGTTITSSGVTSVLPTITTRRASTTVELYDGQTFAIGGLISNNVTETMKSFPGLGEIPILGPLFRSAQFQHDKTELVFVITPHLVKPLPADYKLPTDNFIEPSRKDFFLKGKMEGNPPPKPAQTPVPEQKGDSGFEMK